MMGSRWSRIWAKLSAWLYGDVPACGESFYVPHPDQELCMHGNGSAFCARPKGHDGPHRGMGVNTGKEWS